MSELPTLLRLWSWGPGRLPRRKGPRMPLRWLSAAAALVVTAGCGGHSSSGDTNGVLVPPTAACETSEECPGALAQYCETCTSGQVACNHWACVDGRCRAQVCSCTTAADCGGALPMYCLQCGNGHSACAHWACVSGGCEIETCP